MKKISAVLENEITKKPIVPHIHLKRELLNWKNLFPGKTGQNSHPVDFIDGTLWLYSENSAWNQELHFHKEEILKTLNNLPGISLKITEIRISTQNQGNLST